MNGSAGICHPTLIALRYCCTGTSVPGAQVTEIRHIASSPDCCCSALGVGAAWSRCVSSKTILGTGGRETLRSLWGTAWQTQPLGHGMGSSLSLCSDPWAAHAMMGRELSCCFPFWNPKGRDGEFPSEWDHASRSAALSQGQGVGGSRKFSLWDMSLQQPPEHRGPVHAAILRRAGKGAGPHSQGQLYVPS